MIKISQTVPLLGKVFLQFLSDIGSISIFNYKILKAFLRCKIYWQQIMQQMLFIGYYSLPVVGLTAIFTGAVLALQSYTGFSRFNAESSIASVVVLSITRELGPVLAGLMLAGRVGAAIAAEMGTMKVTEQIDALRALNTDPYNYLVIPRVLAGVLMMPILVLIADIIGIFGGYLVSIYKLGFSEYSFLKNAFNYLEYWDVVSGLIKASCFGFIVTSMGCYYGYNSGKGAQGVGVATTNAVVGGSVLILLANYLITGLLFTK